MANRYLPFLLAISLGVTGCIPLSPAPIRPKSRPVQTGIIPHAPSPMSRTLSTYYASEEEALKARGLLRVDGGGPDTLFDAQDLARNFTSIALKNEYLAQDGRLIHHESAATVRKWQKPVWLHVRFGGSVSEAQKQKDRKTVTRYISRLSTLTGLRIRETTNPGTANYTVLFLDETERRETPPAITSVLGAAAPQLKPIIRDMPRSTLCMVIADISNDGRGAHKNAVALIRSELPDRLRTSCIHEEIAQGLGLVNDSKYARPSIFNDDEEFAYLTTHDELLLRTLYDPRLKVGMTQSQAAPLITTITRELTTR
ncbi:MAG: DUF2927 domain-containing protein [Halocynthiibacter sp.]